MKATVLSRFELMFQFLKPPKVDEPKSALTEEDAIDIWIARWLRIRRIDILRRYKCDPRRLYEIWEGERYPASRDRALKAFKQRFPQLVGQTDFSNHRRIPRGQHPDQIELFE